MSNMWTNVVNVGGGVGLSQPIIQTAICTVTLPAHSHTHAHKQPPHFFLLHSHRQVDLIYALHSI